SREAEAGESAQDAAPAEVRAGRAARLGAASASRSLERLAARAEAISVLASVRQSTFLVPAAASQAAPCPDPVAARSSGEVRALCRGSVQVAALARREEAISVLASAPQSGFPAPADVSQGAPCPDLVAARSLAGEQALCRGSVRAVALCRCLVQAVA